MWTELVKIFRASQPMEAMANEFMEMLEVTRKMALIVRPHIFDFSLHLDQRSEIYKLDIAVNQAERAIRKKVVTHLMLSHDDISYCLLLMTLVKDVERIGDYVKNVSEVNELGGGMIPEGPLKNELKELVDIVMHIFGAAPDIIRDEDHDRANEMIQAGRSAGKRSDRLLVELAKSDFSPSETTSLVMLTRFYKRIGGHLLNILTSLVMPLHKVDFYDEEEVEGS